MFWGKKENTQNKGLVGVIMAGMLIISCLPLKLAKAAEHIVYVSSYGSAENSGLNRESPLNSLNHAKKLLPDGGVIIVIETMKISSECSYYLGNDIVIEADDSLKGALFEIEKAGELTLNNIVMIGRGNTLIQNQGVLRIEQDVTFKVLESTISVSDAVATEEDASTFENEVLLEGIPDGESSNPNEMTGSMEDALESQESPKENADDEAQIKDSKDNEGSVDKSEVADSEGNESLEDKPEAAEQEENGSLEDKTGVVESEEDKSLADGTQTAESEEDRSLTDKAGCWESGKDGSLTVTSKEDEDLEKAKIIESEKNSSKMSIMENNIEINNLQGKSMAGSKVIAGLGVTSANDTKSAASHTVIVGIGAESQDSEDTISGNTKVDNSADSSKKDNSAANNAEDTSSGNSAKAGSSINDTKIISNQNTNYTASAQVATGDNTNPLPIMLSLAGSVIIMILTAHTKQRINGQST